MKKELTVKTIYTYSLIMVSSVIVGALSIGPAMKIYGVYGWLVPCSCFVLGMFFAMKVEKRK